MSWRLRIEIDNGIYHVTARGWERPVIVRDDRDREKWSTLLHRVVVRFGWRFFAWVLMDNHFHLFFQTPEANLSAGMHDLNSGYATWFNRRHRRAGALFQGGFKAILVEDETYCRPIVDRSAVTFTSTRFGQEWSRFRKIMGGAAIRTISNLATRRIGWIDEVSSAKSARVRVLPGTNTVVSLRRAFSARSSRR
jgi:REP element-mobilizing transposase RayT